MSEEYNRKEISQKLMKNVGIIVDNESGDFVFKIPSKVWDVAEKEFKFSFDMLEVGGDISLPELAEHMDKQSSNEARFSSLAEIVRYQKTVAELEFDNWYSKKFSYYKEIMDKGKDTEKTVHGKILRKHGKTYSKLKKVIADLEFKYRLLNNAIYSAIVTKGKMLQSLRNIVQSVEFSGFNSLSVRKKGSTIKGD